MINKTIPLPTVPPVPNTNTIALICPSGSHLIGSKCVVDGAKCPSGLDGGVQEGYNCIKCPSMTPISYQGKGVTQLPVLPGSNTGSTGGGFIQLFPVKPPPATPPTNTPPVQPQTPQQLAPSQPECVPGFHWDNAELKCVAN
jgi:hypothetical protein